MDLLLGGQNLATLIKRANEARGQKTVLAEIEGLIEERFKASNQLAVYGSLVPGGPNHEIVAEIEGIWIQGRVHGDLYQIGWGADLGYPAMRLNPAGPAIPVHVLRSSKLPLHWDRLDRFEGDNYMRNLVLVHFSDGITTVANIYAADTLTGL